MNDSLPLVTFALISYNQENLISEAVASAFAQDYSNLEIIISDDASSDGTVNVIRRLIGEYKGPHSVVARSNSSNAGISGHVNQIFKIAKGSLIVIAAGDDISSPERVTSLVAAWLRNGRQEALLHSNSRVISQDGSWSGQYRHGKGVDPKIHTLEYFINNDFSPLVHGATAAYTSGIFSYFGSLKSDFEDVPLTFRALLIGDLIYVDEPLVGYRVSVNNASGALTRNDGGHTLRWVSASISNLSAIKEDYEIFCRTSKIEVNQAILARLSDLRRRFTAAKGLASPNIFRNLYGLLFLPVPDGFRARLYVAAKFFGIK